MAVQPDGIVAGAVRDDRIVRQVFIQMCDNLRQIKIGHVRSRRLIGLVSEPGFLPPRGPGGGIQRRQLTQCFDETRRAGHNAQRRARELKNLKPVLAASALQLSAVEADMKRRLTETVAAPIRLGSRDIGLARQIAGQQANEKITSTLSYEMTSPPAL